MCIRDRALEYQRRIEIQVRKQQPGLIHDRLEDAANQLSEWVSNIYQLALRLDAYQADDLLSRERADLPQELQTLTAQRQREQNADVQRQLDQVIASKSNQWQTLRQPDPRLQRQAAADIQRVQPGTVALQLKDDAGRKRKRLVDSVARAEKTREDQHAFRVDRPAHVDLALDVDHIPAPHAHGGGDAGGLAEDVVAQLQHGERVDLPDDGAARFDVNRLAQHFVLHKPGDAVEAENLGIDGLAHVLNADQFGACLRRPEIRLLQQIDDRLHLGGQPLAVADEPGGMVDHGADGEAIERFFQTEIERLAQSRLVMPVRLRGEPIDPLQALRHGLPTLVEGDRDWRAVSGLAINASALFASELGSLLAERSGSFALVWQLAAGGAVKVSLRAAGQGGGGDHAFSSGRVGN